MEAPPLQAELVASREAGDEAVVVRRLAQQQLGLFNTQWYAEMAMLNGASYREVLVAIERARAAMDTRVRAVA
jgi:hypothetical protein